jgi:hypothetical protein
LDIFLRFHGDNGIGVVGDGHFEGLDLFCILPGNDGDTEMLEQQRLSAAQAFHVGLRVTGVGGGGGAQTR